MSALHGEVAVVTGSSRGIGRAVARALSEQGASVVVNGRDPDTVAGAVAELESTGPVRGVVGSAAELEVVAALVEAARELGTPSVLVNCAGTAEPIGSSILDIDDAEWTDLVDAHLHATFRTCRAFVPLFVAAGRGVIVNTSSHAFTGIFGGTGYPAGKGGVTSLTHALAAELREHRIRVNAVCPGARTRLSEGEEYEAHVRSLHERGILDDLMFSGALTPPPPEHVAALYAYLASSLADGITGRILVGAGGYVGEFPAPVEEMLTWRDPADNPPWTLTELDRILRRQPATS